MLTTLLICSLPLFLVYYCLTQWTAYQDIPGPILARFTNVYRFLSVYNRNPHNEELALHRRHGDLVRLGPNVISVSGPDYVLQIYGIGKGLVKSDFYSVFQNIVNGRRAASLVAMTDESEHARTKRHVANAYSLSTLVEFEAFVDSTTEVLLRELDVRFAQTGKPCDLGSWLQFYAFDVIGELTFSKRLGFVENGHDVNGIIHSIGANFDYFSVLGQMPWLDSCLGKNPIYVRYFRKPVTSPILKFAQQLLKERLQEDRDGSNGDRKDFLSRFLQIRKESPEPVSDAQVLSYLFMNINAGSDTIASTLRAIIYFLLKNPTTLKKLVDELDTAHQAGHLTLPSPTWHETQSEHTPYLRAVIKEGLRLNPALSLPLERIVPKDGLTLQHPESFVSSSSSSPDSKPKSSKSSTTTFLPSGTIVGINPYVLQRDSRIFGPDPDNFVPSRWLPTTTTNPSTNTSKVNDNNDDDDDRLRRMDNHLLAFGAGKRSCMGKNIAMLELSKLVPALVTRFDLALVRPGEEWVVRNGWALGQKGLVVWLADRDRKGRGVQ